MFCWWDFKVWVAGLSGIPKLEQLINLMKKLMKVNDEKMFAIYTLAIVFQ